MADSNKSSHSKAKKPAVKRSSSANSGSGQKKKAAAKSKVANMPKSKPASKSTGSKSKSANQQKFSVKPEKSMLRYEIELISLFAITILSAVAIHTKLTGFFGELMKGIYLGLFGFAGTLLPYLIFFVIFFNINRFFSDKKWRLIFATLTGFISVWLFSTTVNYSTLYEFLNKQGHLLMSAQGMRVSVDQGLVLRGGGVFGNLLVFGLINAVGKFGAYLLATLLGAFSIVLAFKVSLTNLVKRSGVYTFRGLKPVAGKIKDMPKQMARVVDETKLRNEERHAANAVTSALETVSDDQKIKLSDLPRLERPIETYNSDLYFDEQANSEALANHGVLVNEPETLELIDEETGEYIEVSPLLIYDGFDQDDETEPHVVHYAADELNLMEADGDLYEDSTAGDFEFGEDPDFTMVVAGEALEIEEDFDSPFSDEIEGLSDIEESSNETGILGSELSAPDPDARTSTELAQGSKVIAQSAQKPVPQPVPKPAPKPYILPPLSLLNPAKVKPSNNRDEIVENVKTLEVTLKNFGVDAKVTEVTKGPAITMYEVLPAPGVKVSKIVNLTDDIALALAASQIRIIAPIPGKSAIGIEIPNKDTTMVTAREVFESDEFKKADSKLSYALGKDITGKTMVADLAKMPHMLIAGSTGSGKSVCVNTIINSILFNAKPDEVKLLMIDPKVVELSHYNGIPHLILPVVVDPKKASIALNWAVNEMTNRYKTFAENMVKDINTYNRKAETQPDLKLEKMAKIVILVDELADLMMVAPNQVEDAICRLAQMARAAGIHLIVATQRPSVDVITGLIKANIPSRIAFAVSSQIDSRTILDMAGAEKLLGKGDMLFYPLGANKPVRIQGAFLADQEVESVVEFIKNQGNEVTYQEDILTDLPESAPTMEADELLPDAIDMVVESGQASISMVQRKFRVGYNRAARLIDQMEERGIVGPSLGSKPREVLVTKLELEQMKG